MSSSKIRDSSLPRTFPRDMGYLVIVAVILAIIIFIYNIL